MIDYKSPLFITHKRSGEEGTRMGQTKTVNGVIFYRYALDRSGKTIFLSEQQLKKNWRIDEQ